MDSAILAELRRIGDAVEQLVVLQQALLGALMGEDDEPQTDMEGNLLPGDRPEHEEL